MKKMLVIFGIVLSIVVLLNTCLISATTISCKPVIKILNQDPAYAIPGTYVKVLFEVSGLGTDCNGFAVKLSPEYPFSLDSGYDPVQTLAESPDVRDYNNNWDIPYKIRVADDALEGDYELKLLYRMGNNKDFDSSYTEADFNISVTDSQTEFSIVVQDISGTQVSIGLVNIGRNTANSLIVGIPSQENFKATGITEQIVGNLAAGDYTIVSFDISSINSMDAINSAGRPRSNVSSGNNPQLLKIKLDYTDGIGKRRSVIKEIQLTSLPKGNFTAGGNGRIGPNGSNTSSAISVWWYVVGIIVLIIIGAGIYKGYYRKLFVKIKDFYGKKKNPNRNSHNVPDWVLAEKIHHKK